MPSTVVILGIMLVILGIFAGGRLEWVGLEVVALIATGVLQTLAARRT